MRLTGTPKPIQTAGLYKAPDLLEDPPPPLAAGYTGLRPVGTVGAVNGDQRTCTHLDLPCVTVDGMTFHILYTYGMIFIHMV